MKTTFHIPKQKRHASQRGVVLVIMLLAIVLIASLLYYVLNLGKHVNNRIVVQHSADAATNAHGTWIARQFNTVAMNNITITRYLASIPVMDSQPIIAHSQYLEYKELFNGLQETYAPSTGRNTVDSGLPILDGIIEQELDKIYYEMQGEQQQLFDVDYTFNGDDNNTFNDDDNNTFNGYDVTLDTRYPGNIYDAIVNLNEISVACLENIGPLAELHAAEVGYANLEADNSPGIFVTTIPSRVDIDFKYASHNGKDTGASQQPHFNDFENPVMHGSLPDYMQHRIINRGPFDTVFGQRSLEFSLNQTGLPTLFDIKQPQSLFALHDVYNELQTSDLSPSINAWNLPADDLAKTKQNNDNTASYASLSLNDAVVSTVTSAVFSSPFGGGYQHPPSGSSSESIGHNPTDRLPKRYHTNGILGRIINGLHHNPNHRGMPFNRHINLYRQNYAQWSKYISRNELNHLWPQNGFHQHDRFAIPMWNPDYRTDIGEDDPPISRTAYLRLQIKSRYRWGDDFMADKYDEFGAPTYYVQTNFGASAGNQVEMRDSRQSRSLYMIMTRGWWLGEDINPEDLRLVAESEPEPEPEPQDPNSEEQIPTEEERSTFNEIPEFRWIRPISSNGRMWLYHDNTLVHHVPEGDNQVGVPPFDDSPDSDDDTNNHVVYIYQVLIYLGVNENPIYTELDRRYTTDSNLPPKLNPHDNTDLTQSQARQIKGDNTFASDSQIARKFGTDSDSIINDDNYAVEIENPFEDLDRDAMPGPVLLANTNFDRDDKIGECEDARQSVQEYIDNKLTFMAYASRQNRAAFWPRKFDRTKPTNRSQAVAQGVVFNNHSFDLWTPMWQVQLQQTTNFQNWVDHAITELDNDTHPRASAVQLEQMINHLQAVSELAEIRLAH